MLTKLTETEFPVNTLKDFYIMVLKGSKANYARWKRVVLSVYEGEIKEKLDRRSKVLLAMRYSHENTEMLQFMKKTFDAIGEMERENQRIKAETEQIKRETEALNKMNAIATNLLEGK